MTDTSSGSRQKSKGWRLLPFAFVLLSAGSFSCRDSPRVVISTREGKELTVQVEVADTPAKREQGLQYRRELGDDQGMLFLYPSERPQTFWMKNTPIPLDLIFIDGDRRIVGVVQEAVPFSTAILSVSVPSQFVLEIKGGLSRHRGIGVGDAVRFEGISLERLKD
jgi:uncharacterized membrane protein (UPF0127 family)